MLDRPRAAWAMDGQSAGEAENGSADPVLVNDRVPMLEALTDDLVTRYGVEFRVLGEPSPAAALVSLQRLGDESAEIALVIAAHRMGEMPGVDVLVRAHELHPTAKRVLLIGRRDWTAANPAVRAMALGQIDTHLFEPWLPVERWLYLPISQVLADWVPSRAPASEGIRIVGPQRGGHVATSCAICSPAWESPTGGTWPTRIRVGDCSQTPARTARGCPWWLFHSGRVFVDPSNAELAAALGFGTRPATAGYNLAIIGAGPAGLAAAVYAASEGLGTLVVEPQVVGGQAGTSALIRNYLGFPRGISGNDLANRVLEQAWLFGAHLVLTQHVTDLHIGGRDRRVQLSAGQAAVHLAKWADSVTVLVRGNILGQSMSDYLWQQIEATPNITVRLHTEVVDGHGGRRLEGLVLHDTYSGVSQDVPAAALFVMIGAEPRTESLTDSVERDSRGYILTGHDLLRDGTPPPGWPLQRPPLLPETSVPGVFAAGDVRHRSIKRVASAVGEGAVAVQLVRDYLTEQPG